MPGLSDFLEQSFMNYLACSLQMAVLPGGTIPTVTAGNFTNVGLWLALFNTAPTSDAGTGGTEVTTAATNYARQQIGGVLTTNGTTAAGNAILHFAAVPAWLLGPSPSTGLVSVQVRDITTPASIPAATTILGTGGSATQLTMSANAAGAGVGGTDIISFSVFGPATASTSNPEPGTLPGGLSNAAIVTMNQSTGAWGTVPAFGIYDAVTAGNFLAFDYIGNFKWLPFSCTLASPGVFTSPAHGYSNGDSVVVTQKYGGTLPTTGGSFAGILTVANVTTDTFTVGVNTTSTGDGQVRKITQQVIGGNTTPSFAAGQLLVTAA
jgi:hypothetical protein